MDAYTSAGTNKHYEDSIHHLSLSRASLTVGSTRKERIMHFMDSEEVPSNRTKTKSKPELQPWKLN